MTVDYDNLLATAARFDVDKVDPHSRYVIVKLAAAVRDLQDQLQNANEEKVS